MTEAGVRAKDISPPTADEEKKFLDSLVSCSGAKPVVLSVLPTYLHHLFHHVLTLICLFC